MKQKRVSWCLALLTALNLLIPAAAVESTSRFITLENDNHYQATDSQGNYIGTDTLDYCLRAHDVQITHSSLRALMAEGEEALKEALERASQYEFFLRGRGFKQLREGYTTDVSQVRAEVAEEGYPVTVTLPAVTEGVVSKITYRVYVVADSYRPPEGYLGYAESEDFSIWYTDKLTVFASQWKAWGETQVQDAELAKLLEYEAVNAASVAMSTIQGAISIRDYVIEPPEYPSVFDADITFFAENGAVATGELTVKVIADPDSTTHQLTIRHLDENGREVWPVWTAEYEDGSPYDVTNEVMQNVAGYTFSHTDGALSGFIVSDVEIIVSYRTIPPPVVDDNDNNYRIIVRYVNRDTGEELIPRWRSSSIREGRRYDVGEQTALALDGYTITEVSGTVSGWIQRDVTVTVYYSAVVDGPVVPDVGDEGNNSLRADEPEPPAENNTSMQGPLDKDEESMPPVNRPSASESEENQMVDVADEATDPQSTTQGSSVSGMDEPYQSIDPIANSESIYDRVKAPVIPVEPEIPGAEADADSSVPRSISNMANPGTYGEGVNQAYLLLMTIGCAIVTGLSGSIFSDLRVLRWYEERKRRNGAI